MEGVHRKVDVGHAGRRAVAAGAAVGAGEGAEVGDLVAIGQYLAVLGAADVEADDALLIQRGEFVALADAVLVEILPYAQRGEVGILRIDDTVVVGVFLRQCGEAVGGIARGAVGRRGVAEQLGAGIDHAVAVAIHDQQAVVGGNPADTVLDAGGIDVEQQGRGFEGDGVEAVAVQVEGERVAAVGRFLGAGEEITNSITNNFS